MNQDENIINQIFLPHRHARWVLTQFFSQSGETVDDLERLLKSLKKLGVPFSFDEMDGVSDFDNNYMFENLMELFLIIILRAYRYEERDLARLIVKHRSSLRVIFRRAFLERNSGLGAPKRLFVSRPVTSESKKTSLKTFGHFELVDIRGTYLDLRIASYRGKPPEIVNLELLGPEDAVNNFMTFHRNIYPHPPIPISNMAEDLVRVAEGPFPMVSGFP